MNGWIGVDLDGTLAEYHGWKGPEHIGPPVAAMVERVNRWLDEGVEVRIFTARISAPTVSERQRVRDVIGAWTTVHLGRVLPVTCTKDYAMVELYDDRCVAVEQNTGRLLNEPQPRFTP